MMDVPVCNTVCNTVCIHVVKEKPVARPKPCGFFLDNKYLRVLNWRKMKKTSSRRVTMNLITFCQNHILRQPLYKVSQHKSQM